MWLIIAILIHIPDNVKQFDLPALPMPFDPGQSDSISHPGCSAEKQEKKAGGKEDLMQNHSHPRSYGWSELFKRVFKWDGLRCECGNRMRILCAINRRMPYEKSSTALACQADPRRFSPQ